MPSLSTGDREFAHVNSRLKAIADKVKNMAPFFKKISVELDRSVQLNFERDGHDYIPGGWPALKPFRYGGVEYTNARLKYPKISAEAKATKLVEWMWSTKQQMRKPLFGKVEQNAKILRDTGKGRASIIPYSNSKIAKIGTTDKTYMAAHHTGTKDGRLPARPVVPEYRHVKSRVLALLNYELKRIAGI